MQDSNHGKLFLTRGVVRLGFWEVASWGFDYPYRPQDRGFVRRKCLVSLSSSIPSVPAYWGNDYFDDVYMHNGKEKRFKGYCADVFFNEAMRLVSESAKSKKPLPALSLPLTPHTVPSGPRKRTTERILRRYLLSPSSITWIIMSKSAWLFICRNDSKY